MDIVILRRKISPRIQADATVIAVALRAEPKPCQNFKWESRSGLFFIIFFFSTAGATTYIKGLPVMSVSWSWTHSKNIKWLWGPSSLCSHSSIIFHTTAPRSCRVYSSTIVPSLGTRRHFHVADKPCSLGRCYMEMCLRCITNCFAVSAPFVFVVPKPWTGVFFHSVDSIWELRKLSKVLFKGSIAS